MYPSERFDALPPLEQVSLNAKEILSELLQDITEERVSIDRAELIADLRNFIATLEDTSSEELSDDDHHRLQSELIRFSERQNSCLDKDLDYLKRRTEARIVKGAHTDLPGAILGRAKRGAFIPPVISAPMLSTDQFSEDLAEDIRSGSIPVIPTDTLYGIVASALDPDAVERIYELKGRDPEKPLIVLISDIDDVESFGVVVGDRLRDTLTRYWPGPNSIILRSIDESFDHLTRGGGTIAFRLPDDAVLRDLLRLSGPVVAPSANPEGGAPARTIDEAKNYFGDSVDHYIDDGERSGGASTIIDLTTDEPKILRRQ